MKQKLLKIAFVIVVSLTFAIILSSNTFSAQRADTPIIIDVHEHEYIKETILPTCEEDGYDIYTCVCGDTYTENVVSATGHIYNEWILTTPPTSDMHGEETHNCKVCGKIESQEYVCPHEALKEVLHDATCTEKGLSDIYCEFCNALIETKIIDIKPHDYSSWKTITYATPEKNGEQYKECSCGKTEYRTTTFKPAGNTAIYIEGTGINHKMAVTSFSQYAVDTNDICYTNTRIGKNNPIVLGHNTGTLKLLQKTKVGSKIYVWINGELTIYKVILSEKAKDLGHDIEGVSGERLLTEYEGPHLHLYTCHVESTGMYKRWLVLAEKIS